MNVARSQLKPGSADVLFWIDGGMLWLVGRYSENGHHSWMGAHRRDVCSDLTLGWVIGWEWLDVRKGSKVGSFQFTGLIAYIAAWGISGTTISSIIQSQKLTMSGRNVTLYVTSATARQLYQMTCGHQISCHLVGHESLWIIMALIYFFIRGIICVGGRNEIWWNIQKWVLHC